MMVLVQFEDAVTGEDDQAYIARVCGRQAADNMWEGWIEFDPGGGASVLRTPRETTQPNQQDLEYWATGLTEAYLQGALERAGNPHAPDLRSQTLVAKPTYDGPAPSVPESGRTGRSGRPTHAVLDPFRVYRQGEDLLRGELGALDEDHLRNIVRAHDLISDGEIDLVTLNHTALVDLIIGAVRRRAD